MYTKSSFKRISAVASLLLAAGVGAAHAEPGYYPEGPQRNVSLSTLIDDGWERCFSDSYGASGTLVITAQEACTGNYLMLAGRATESEEILLLAAAPREDIWTITESQQTRFVNGSYWYFVPVRSGQANSIGFSRTSNVYIYTCDYDDEGHGVPAEESEYKLCWHIESEGTLESAYFDSGYRIGSDTSLNDDEGEYLREIYMHAAPKRDILFSQDANFNQLVAKCKREFVRDVQAQINPSLARYESCLFTDVTKSNISSVNSDLLAQYKASLVAGKPMTEAEIIAAVHKFALRATVLDRLVNAPKTVFLNDLVDIGLTGLLDVKSRYQAIAAVRDQSATVRGDFKALESLISNLPKD